MAPCSLIHEKPLAPLWVVWATALTPPLTLAGFVATEACPWTCCILVGTSCPGPKTRAWASPMGLLQRGGACGSHLILLRWYQHRGNTTDSHIMWSQCDKYSIKIHHNMMNDQVPVLKPRAWIDHSEHVGSTQFAEAPSAFASFQDPIGFHEFENIDLPNKI